jgi:molecular chaperone GrpE
LAKEGLERIDPLGEEFDPNAHEAVGHLPAEGPDPVGGSGSGATGGPDTTGEPVVGQVMRAGYRWRGTVIRPAMVMVRG